MLRYICPTAVHEARFEDVSASRHSLLMNNNSMCSDCCYRKNYVLLNGRRLHDNASSRRIEQPEECSGFVKTIRWQGARGLGVRCPDGMNFDHVNGDNIDRTKEIDGGYLLFIRRPCHTPSPCERMRGLLLPAATAA